VVKPPYPSTMKCGKVKDKGNAKDIEVEVLTGADEDPYVRVLLDGATVFDLNATGLSALLAIMTKASAGMAKTLEAKG
jgi:hypothetical protein